MTAKTPPRQIATRVNDEIADAFDRVAKRNGRKVAQENRQAILHWLEIHGEKVEDGEGTST